jgi:hypothetical protein
LIFKTKRLFRSVLLVSMGCKHHQSEFSRQTKTPQCEHYGVFLFGLGGVQARHYDRHNYMAEKRSTLEMWSPHQEALEKGRAREVIPMRQYR